MTISITFHARSRIKGIEFYGRGVEYGTTHWGRRRYKMGRLNVFNFCVTLQQRHLQAVSVTCKKSRGSFGACEARSELLRNRDV